MEASPAAAPLFPALLEQGLAQPSFLKSVSRQEGHKMPQSQGTWAGTAVAEETVPEHPWVPELAWDQHVHNVWTYTRVKEAGRL